jgi:hypothetical protein
MSLFRRILQAPVGPDLFAASSVNIILTATGVSTFVGGVLYLPALGLGRGESVIAFLLLLTIPLLCSTLGQLFVLNEQLAKRRD